MSEEKFNMEPALELPCQTVAFLQVPKNIACGIMKSMPTININYDVRKHDLLLMNNMFKLIRTII